MWTIYLCVDFSIDRRTDYFELLLILFSSTNQIKRQEGIETSYNFQKDWKDTRVLYNQNKQDVNTALSKILRLLWSHCDLNYKAKC